MRTIRLLVVEDSPAYLFFIQSAFREHKGDILWELTVAADGAEALHLLFAEETGGAPLPDLILLDWNLPKVSGNDVLRRLKEHPKLCKIPVLVFSSSDADKDIHDAYAGHANGYITKPGSARVMAAIVESLGQFWVTIVQLPKVLR
jgi:chemotaxis family two-component system response regulator Rcp1